MNADIPALDEIKGYLNHKNKHKFKELIKSEVNCSCSVLFSTFSVSFIALHTVLLTEEYNRWRKNVTFEITNTNKTSIRDLKTYKTEPT